MTNREKLNIANDEEFVELLLKCGTILALDKISVREWLLKKAEEEEQKCKDQ